MATLDDPCCVGGYEGRGGGMLPGVSGAVIGKEASWEDSLILSVNVLYLPAVLGFFSF